MLHNYRNLAAACEDQATREKSYRVTFALPSLLFLVVTIAMLPVPSRLPLLEQQKQPQALLLLLLVLLSTTYPAAVTSFTVAVTPAVGAVHSADTCRSRPSLRRSKNLAFVRAVSNKMATEKQQQQQDVGGSEDAAASAVPALRRLPTFRSMSSTISADSSVLSSGDASDTAGLSDRSSSMAERASKLEPFTESEIEDVVHSIQNVCPATYGIDYGRLAGLLREVAHLSHKNWTVTGANSARLGQVLFPPGGEGFSAVPEARQLLDRILREGNWDGAAKHAASATPASGSMKPWAVLVTGVNGIRKTTSMYQWWFPSLLKEALVPPSDGGGDVAAEFLPSGQNSFFRQLDHMIATLCNEDFSMLYGLTSDAMGGECGREPPPDVVELYTQLKAAIFSRFRTLSELLGALLLREAQTQSLNCMMETSGRDVAMFNYVDHFFPEDAGYRKLALHFQINDLSLAKGSVDDRMVREIVSGIDAAKTGDVFAVIDSNAGGPYGSQVLDGIQEESDAVWKSQILSGKVGKDWFKATIQINAHADKPWTARAVKPDGSLGTEYAFE